MLLFVLQTSVYRAALLALNLRYLPSASYVFPFTLRKTSQTVKKELFQSLYKVGKQSLVMYLW